MDTTGRGVLDTPQVRRMTISCGAALLLLAILIPASPAFAEQCSKPAARSRIAETLPLRFEVLLRLMGARERLSVPFTAIKAFWDKSELKCSDS